MGKKRIVGTVVLLMLLLGVVGIALGPHHIKVAAWRYRERIWLEMTGHLVDVGGHRLHLEWQGQGSPTVIMDAGLCQPMETWSKVSASVADLTSVVTYSRAGLGWSDPVDNLRTSDEMVTELHTLLQRANVPPPYVLVGHSFGCLNMCLYASRYPDEVVGMVLVDASHPDQVGQICALLPEDVREGYVHHEQGNNGEHVDIVASGERVSAASLCPMPLFILTAEQCQWPADWPTAQLEGLRHALQEDLTTLSPNSVHIVVPGSGHFIQQDQPEAVINAICTIVKQCRQQ